MSQGYLARRRESNEITPFPFESHRTKTKAPFGVFVFCGSGEIRTHGPIAEAPVFKTGAIDHSATLPWETVSYGGILFNICGRLVVYMTEKYIGVDYGTKKVGIALSDESGSFAFPYAIVTPQTLKETILSMKEKEPIAGIVFGLSVATNGATNELSDTIRVVAGTLTHIAPVYFEQEMFSSVEAHRYQTDAGDRDDSAAAIILQRFLDKKKK